MACTMPLLQGWEELPEDLLRRVVHLLFSFRDLLAFGGTCPSWRAFLSSCLPESAFSTASTLCPPLLLHPNPKNLEPPPLNPNPFEFRTPGSFPDCFGISQTTHHAQRNFRESLDAQTPHSFTDLAGANSTPRELRRPEKNGTSSSAASGSFVFIGASFGRLILRCSDNSCMLVDAFTGARLSSPRFPGGSKLNLSYGALTAPLTSPDSHLVVSSADRRSTFFWRVDGGGGGGGYSCLEIEVRHVVAFRGKVFAMGSSCRRLFRVDLTPPVSKENIEIVAGKGTTSSSAPGRLAVSWLVPCGGDMLLLVGIGARGTLEAYRLDMLTTRSAKWVKVDRLENWAVFASCDERSQAISCKNPERWGGRSNHVYCARESPKDEVERKQQPMPMLNLSQVAFKEPMLSLPSQFAPISFAELMPILPSYKEPPPSSSRAAVAPEQRKPSWPGLAFELGQPVPMYVALSREDFLQPSWAVPVSSLRAMVVRPQGQSSGARDEPESEGP